MLLSIDTRSPMPLHAQIADGIQLAIARGDLAPGDRLPTVRELAVDLKVNSNTVARVYGTLERAGVIETRRGKGSFVRAPPRLSPGARDRRLQALCHSFARAFAAEGFSIAEIRNELASLANKKEVHR